MYLIRKAEDVIIENYCDDDMKTPMHMSRGEEAIIAGACAALKREDQVFGSYRSHALYLAKTGDTDGFFAEMYGKITGACGGKAGSMHLSNPSKGHISCSAVVASNLPVAVGAAWANKMKKNGKIVVIFFGDGAVDEGSFWESVNMACLWKLPILFICEDNDLAVHTSSSKRHGYYNISDFMDSFYMTNYDHKTTRVDHVYNTAKRAINDIKTEGKPSFIKFQYYRYLEHVGVNEDSVISYREGENIEEWWDDPLDHWKDMMERDGPGRYTIEKAEKEIDEQIYKSLEFAKSSEFPPLQDVYKDVFYE